MNLFDKSIDKLEQLIISDPYDPIYHYYKGRCLQEKGEYAHAIQK